LRQGVLSRTGRKGSHRADWLASGSEVGRIDSHAARSFPNATRIGFFTRPTSARGSYEVEVQLHDEAGQVV
jgi:hypothetical protein